MKKIEPADLHRMLREGQELALVDVRPQEKFIRGQILASVNIPYDRLDSEAPSRIPRKSVMICIVSDDDALGRLSLERLKSLGYLDVSLVSGGTTAWMSLNLPLFEDVNAESKAFGEFVEHAYNTPNITPDELHARVRDDWKPAIIDCRPRREHVFAHIPGAVNVTGGELYRLLPLVCDGPDQPVVVHCGGRTRGIIAAQGLINAGYSNPISVLMNGTMGWHLCGYELESGANLPDLQGDRLDLNRHTELISDTVRAKLGDLKIERDQFRVMLDERERRSLYVFDLRPEEERLEPTPLGLPAAAGQLIQATDEYIAVRGARVVLVDDDMARAAMTASWLRQMGWRETFVLAVSDADLDALHSLYLESPEAPDGEVGRVDAKDLSRMLEAGEAVVFDVSQSHEYLAGHVPGALYSPRAQLVAKWSDVVPADKCIVLASTKPQMSAMAAGDLSASGAKLRILEGGTAAWGQAGYTLDIGVEGLIGETSWLTQDFAKAIRGKEQIVKEFVDWELERFFDPFKSQGLEDAMKKYLKWEIDLVSEWQRDGTARFARLP